MVERDQAIDKILDALRDGLPEYVAAQAGGITFKTWWTWRQEIPGLTQRAAEAKRGRIILYEDALHKAAIKGNVTACLTLLRKESQEWRELLDGRIIDPNAAAMGMLAAAGAAAIINMLSDEKRKRVKLAMMREGILQIPPSYNNGDNSKENGSGH